MIDKYHTDTKVLEGRRRGGECHVVGGGFIMAGDIWVRRGAGLKDLHGLHPNKGGRKREGGRRKGGNRNEGEGKGRWP